MSIFFISLTSLNRFEEYFDSIPENRNESFKTKIITNILPIQPPIMRRFHIYQMLTKFYAILNLKKLLSLLFVRDYNNNSLK